MGGVAGYGLRVAPPDRIPARLADRYDLDRVIGRGGMATVFAAHDRRLGREVAVKVVDVAAADATTRERFVREARAAAGIRHRHSVAVFDAGESEGLLYIVMELVAGHSVAEELVRNGPLTPARAATVAHGVLDALGTAHAAGTVHRDVKPANVMVTDDGDVRLLDFGIAHQLDDLAATLTETGTVVGTAAYLAPERVTGGASTAQSDLYAVGVLLFEMLTGAPPYSGDTPIAVASAHVHAPVPDVRDHRPDVPPALAEVIARALAKQPGARYPDAAAMQGALTGSSRTATAVYPQAGSAHVMTRRLRTGPAERPRTPVWPSVVVGAFTLLLVVGGAIVFSRRDAVPPVAAAPSTSPAVTAAPASTIPAAVDVPPTTLPPTVPTTVAVAPTPPPTTAPPMPETLAELRDLLAADPARYGTRTDEVVERLEHLGHGRKARDRAAELLERVDAWLDSGELTPDAGALIRPVVERATQPGGDGSGPGPGPGDGPGPGPGG